MCAFYALFVLSLLFKMHLTLKIKKKLKKELIETGPRLSSWLSVPKVGLVVSLLISSRLP